MASPVWNPITARSSPRSTPPRTSAGFPTIVVLGTIGAPDLHPEREREIEGGFDAYLWNQTATLEFSVYQKNLSDLLVPRALHESSGYITEFLNGGAMKTQGLEIAAAVQPIQKRQLQLAEPGHLLHHQEQHHGAGRARLRDRRLRHFDRRFQDRKRCQRHADRGNDTTANGSIVVHKVGEANPKFRMGFVNDFVVHDFTLHTVLDWQYGGDILNLTKLLYDFGGVTKDFDKPISGSSRDGGTAPAHRIRQGDQELDRERQLPEAAGDHAHL